ncbi:6-phosphofructo-2-kinase/fructose-2,6-bisphosphatase-like isoform X1 [Macrosteles quadrilineatus]|uniref:6-phosphofructo-2-kinase/fructose-2, 6-bisphosphatase-like isoform X1 n=1 Tax=Macrosteles quadrilineatus TaxID=74068 RepID=UPI0023E1BDAC|nr:6-phosphofructo-2-kinase/fructose-2,6-bisphosphatase-like isoform X1 [Macrosteles quadrilineatus]
MAPTGFSLARKESDDGKLCPKLLTKKADNFAPLVVAMVGLPARGKTVLSHKLNRYLNWNGLKSKVFSISFYRRKHIELYDSHEIFRADNEEAYEIIQQSAKEAMEDALDFLKSEGKIAILDGTHATPKTRQNTFDFFAKQYNFKVLFLECICDDDMILERNIKEILQFSKDYKHMTKEKALDDFHHKIEHFMEQYEPINPREESKYTYIKVFNDGENVSVHRINGPYQSNILSFVSSFKPGARTLYFSRHGESEYNVVGRIGGDTDLSPRGRMYAKTLATYINDANIPDLHVWTSEKRRTKQTAAGIAAPSEPVEALNELDAGICEGLSYEEMQDKFPQEFAWRDQDKLRYRYPWGESYVDIMARLAPVLLELEHEDNLLTISHQAVLRCILGYFLNKSLDELPYINVPLHTVIKMTIEGYKCNIEFIKLNVECVDTYRKQPKNCSVARPAEEALLTVPAHYDNLWPLKQQLLQH